MASLSIVDGKDAGYDQSLQIESGRESLKSRIDRAHRITDLVDLLRSLKDKNGEYDIEDCQELRRKIVDCNHPNTFKNVFRESVEQKWGYVFANLKEGDVIATMLFPSAEFLSIKKLNAIFGESVADMIRDKGFELMSEFSKNENFGFEVLQLEFGKEIIKAKDGVSEIDFQEQLEQISVEFSAKMTDFINEEIGKLIEVSVPEKAEEMRKFLSNLNGENETLGGFHKTFGISKVSVQEGDNNFSNILMAVSKSVQMAQFARQLSSEQNKDDFEHGTIFDEDQVASMVNEIQKDYDYLVAVCGNKILIYGEEVDIFEEFDQVGDIDTGVVGRLRINPKVLYSFRKGEIDDGQEDLVRKLGRYFKTVNLVDLIRPYTYEEVTGNKIINGETVSDMIEGYIAVADFVEELLGVDNDSQALEIMNERFEENIDVLLNVLTMDSKDGNCTSRSEFYSRMRGREGFVVSMDFVGVGVDQLMAYEQVVQDLEGFNFVAGSNMPSFSAEQIKELEIGILSASDEITERLRKARAVCREKFGENVLMAVGGDEVMIFVESDDKDEVLKNVLEYQETCNGDTSVFPVRVSMAKKVGDRSEDIVETVFKTERGVDYSKKIEKDCRTRKETIEPFCVFVNGQEEVFALVGDQIKVITQ